MTGGSLCTGKKPNTRHQDICADAQVVYRQRAHSERNLRRNSLQTTLSLLFNCSALRDGERQRETERERYRDREREREIGGERVRE